MTFGLSAHLLTGADGQERRQELLLLLRGEDETAVQIAVSVGKYMLDGHVALVVGETVSTPGGDDGPLDRIVAAEPEPLPTRFGCCAAFEPPVEFVWLLPYAHSEHHLVAEHGWRDLLRWISERGESPYDLRRGVVV